MRSSKLAAICLACALPVIAIGAEPEGGNKPQGAPVPGAGFQPGRRDPSWRGATEGERAQAMQAFEKMSNEERTRFREELEKFCAATSPNRWQEVQKRFEI